VDTILAEKLEPVFAAHGIIAAYLFGSQADGTAYPESDYDFGVLLEHPPALENIALIMQDISDALSDILNKDVDIVILNTTNIELRFSIISRGKLVFDTDYDKRTDFEDIAIRDYLDFKPFLDAYYREVKEAVKEGGFYG